MYLCAAGHRHTHTRTLACQSVLHERAAKENAKARQGEGVVENARKTIRIHNSVGCRSASGTRPASDVRLCCAVLLLMSLPHSCRCIASMPQRGICHIGMCTMEITMQSQAGRQQLTNNHPKIYPARCIFEHTKPKCRRASHEPKPKSNPETKQAAKGNASPLPPSPMQHNIKQSSSVARCRFQFRCRFYIAYICRGCCCCCWIGLDRMFLGRLARVLSLGWLLQLQPALTAEGLSGLRAGERKGGGAQSIFHF